MEFLINYILPSLIFTLLFIWALKLSYDTAVIKYKINLLQDELKEIKYQLNDLKNILQ